MGALAAARRTESSFPTFLASTNPSDLSLGTALWNPALGYTTGYNAPSWPPSPACPTSGGPRATRTSTACRSQRTGRPTAAAEKANINVEGSVDGLYFNQDRVTVVQGRMADPKRANEIMMTVGAAGPGPPRRADRHLGHLHQRPVRTRAARRPPALHERLTLVGTVVLNNAVVQDEIDANGPTTVILTPALTGGWSTAARTTRSPTCSSTRAAATCPPSRRRSSARPAVLPYDFYDTSIDVTKAQNAIKPEAIALGVFGLIAALAAILIAGQVIGRQLGFWARRSAPCAPSAPTRS